MNAKHLSWVLGAGALLLCAGAASLAAGNGAVPLGQSLSGESCRLSGADILCGDAQEPSGTVRISQLAAAVPSDPAGRRAAILAGAKALPGGLATVQDITCDPAQWIGAAGNEAALYLCTLRSNNWPRVILVSAGGSTLVAAEGLPGMLPVLEAALQTASGRAASAGEVEAATALVMAKYSAAALRFGASDFARYKDYVEKARLYGGADNYAGAEDAYRQALDIETRLFGADSLAVGETLAELALQVSNQGRFDEAAALFRRASPIIEGSASATARARLASYQALDAANQRNFADALKFARAATAMRRAEVDAAKVASVSGDANSGELTAPVTLEGELAHCLRIEAEMALRLGDNASAQAAAEEALWIITEEPGLPLWWRPEMVALMGEVNAAQGRVVIAERDFTDALALDKKLFGDTAPTARAQLRLGRFYAEQQVYAASVAAFRAAFAILAKDPVARSQIVSDQIVPFLAAASALGRQDPAQRAALDADMFRAVQLVNSGVADQTIARVAARQAAGDAALADLVRQLQDAQHARDNARLELVAENAKPNDERSASLLAKYDAEFKAASGAADALQSQVAQRYPDYARLADPGPVGARRFPETAWPPGEAFLTFVVGAKGSFALVVTAERVTAKPLDATTQSLAGDIAALRSAFVPKLGRLADFSLKSSYALYQQLLAPVEPALVWRGSSDRGAGRRSRQPAAVAAGHGRAGRRLWQRRLAHPPHGGHPGPVAARFRFAARRARQAGARAATLLRRRQSILRRRHHQRKGAGRARRRLPAGRHGRSGAAARLPPLPETAGEVQTVGRPLGAQPGSILLGAGRHRRRGARRQKLEQYAVLYFATHGMLPGELHCQAEPGLVLSPPAGAPASSRLRRLAQRQRDCRPQAQRRSRRPVGLQHGGRRRREVRRRRAGGPGRCLLQRRRPCRARQPLGSAFGGDAEADDRRLRALCQGPVARSGRSLAPVATGADRAAGDGASLQLGRLHADRRQRRYGARTAAPDKRRMTMGAQSGSASLAAALLAGGAAQAANLIVVEARGIGLKPGTTVDSTKPLVLKQGQHVTLISDAGATLSIDGPYNQPPSAGGGGKSLGTTLAALTTEHNARTGEAGVTRGAAPNTLPEPWLFDVTRSGNVCLQENLQPVFWRPDAKTVSSLTVMPVDRSWKSQATWPTGLARITVTTDVPVHGGAAYVVNYNGTDYALADEHHSRQPRQRFDARRLDGPEGLRGAGGGAAPSAQMNELLRAG